MAFAHIQTSLQLWKYINEFKSEELLKKPAFTEKFANTVMSKEFKKCFIYTKDPLLSFDQYKDIVDKYHTFTTWLLGEFYYLLSGTNLDIIIEVQVYIMQQLSQTHLDTYSDLEEEYLKGFSALVGNIKKPQEKLLLEIFLPRKLEDFDNELNLSRNVIEIKEKQHCLQLIKSTLKILKFILPDNILFMSCNEKIYNSLEELIYLACHNYFQLEIFEILNDILSKLHYHTDDWHPRFLTIIESYCSLLEQFTYNFYNTKITKMNSVNTSRFEEILIMFLKTCQKSKSLTIQNSRRILKFLFDKTVDDSENIPSQKVLQEVVKSYSLKYVEEIDPLLEKVLNLNNSTIFSTLKHIILEEICESFNSKPNIKELNIYEGASKTWTQCYKLFISKIKSNISCDKSCELKSILEFGTAINQCLFEIWLKFKKKYDTKCTFLFIDESELLPEILHQFVSHRMSNCDVYIEKTLLLKFLVSSVALTSSRNIDVIFNLIYCPYLVKIHYKNESQLPKSFIGKINHAKFGNDMKSLYSMLITDQNFKKIDLLTVGSYFLQVVSSGLLQNINHAHIQLIETLYLKILNHVKDSGELDDKLKAFESIPHFMTLASNRDIVIQSFITPLLRSNQKVTIELLKIITKITCCSSGNFIKLISNDSVEIFCQVCDLELHNLTLEEYLKDTDNVIGIEFLKTKFDRKAVESTVLEQVLKIFHGSSAASKCEVIKLLPRLSAHFAAFFSLDVVRIWIEFAADPNIEIRMSLAKALFSIVSNGLRNPGVTKETTDAIMEAICSAVFRITKKSLSSSNFKLQETILSTIDALVSVQFPAEFGFDVKLECMKMLLYLIMTPTSAHSLLALSKCLKLSKRDAKNKFILFEQNKKELCELIAHLCHVNHHVINYMLKESLIKISIFLNYETPKDFIMEERKFFLPVLVRRFQKNAPLLEDMASLLETDVADMIKDHYGNIFLYLFLGDIETSETKECYKYIERTTKMTGPALRKMNIPTIFNELLLNFHSKRNRVMHILELLLQDNNSIGQPNSSLADCIASQFLQFLLYFDLEWSEAYSKKDNLLLSLADLMRFMGSDNIVPFRFKIIAMLQTKTYNRNPEIYCEVWDAFIKTCDVYYLGPHLATIFVSLMPFLQECTSRVNKMFEYLIVHNEARVKENIFDLFFVNNNLIHESVLNVIIKSSRTVENYSVKAKMETYLKYLKHDKLELRVQSLKQLKSCIEKNREELDRMILGYNGIDSSLVELIDHLTLGCREKDDTLKLICAEIFGELGAIEPSHLPRRYVQDKHSFIFFISDDAFVKNSLQELLKTFQSDKNVRDTDRVALAIQEILRVYDISPNETSSRRFLWTELPDSQRQIMAPLLSSHYTCVVGEGSFSIPVYGGMWASSFQTWILNWTSSLISTLPKQRKELLQSCYPSMKLDKGVLMHFLPYVFLHSLIEGDATERCFAEFETIINSFNTKELDENIFNLRSLPMPDIAPKVGDMTAEKGRQIQCTKIVFILLDFLDRWLREWRWKHEESASTDRNYQLISRFLKRFCKLELAKCNYNCGEYPRALMYLEDYITENAEEVSSHSLFLTEIYAQLDEPDGVMGVDTFQQTEPSLEQRLISLEVSGKLADAVAIYEHMHRPLKLDCVKGLIQCYLDLDKVNTALYFAEGALDMQPEFANMMLEMQAEPLWRLGQYERLEDLVQKPELLDNNSWGLQVGRALVHLQNNKRDAFRTVLDAIKHQQVEYFSAASLKEGAYQDGYSYITRLHCLSEIEQVEKALNGLFLKPDDKGHAEIIMNTLSKEWQLRLKIVQESVKIVEPILCIRKVTLNLARKVAEKKARSAVPYFDSLLGDVWLQSITVARNAGAHEQAFTYTLEAEKYCPPKLFLEKAKLHWLREEHEEAIITLKRGLNGYIPENSSSQEVQKIIAGMNDSKRKICAEAKLLIATYNDLICSVDVDLNREQYREAVEIYKEWEKSLVSYAQYQDRILQNFSDEEKDTRANDLQLHIINNFGRSLLYGTNFIYQSMPRILSIWFDYGTRVLNVTNTGTREERKSTLIKMTKLIDGFLDRLPPFIFLTSFSQIISRIAHPQKEVYVQLKSIIVKLLLHYPQQCLWMISSVIKSSYPMRAKRCAEILSDPRLKTNAMSKLIKDFTSLAEKLIELTNKEIANDVSRVTVSFLLKSLPRMLSKGDLSEIMMPTHRFRKLILPNPDLKSTHHNPFPNQYVHIVGIEDEITILPSLQKPRRITLKGSDGKGYIFMLKPKDDLRKDFRLMEFNDIVNHLLIRDPEARQRRLNIRLYSVAPLNEECGLIEWVPNLTGLRPILLNLYKQRGIGMRARELKEHCPNLKDPLSKKRDIFTKVLLKRHQPVLGDWFRKTFPDPQTWLTARTGYIRTTAVMSIAGYMLGLGDRHGENILLDSTCGDVVHVDFNCLFNKGESFEWPERVPFRLTQNMVSAMGPLEVEGVFRKSCECTLRVLRSNTATLMSIVTPFVYDPLVSWPRNAPAAAHSSEKTNEQALEHIKNIELRLQGKVKTKSRAMSQCLSVEGQADYLIREAVSVDNLCQMYIGWGGYL